MKKINKIRIVNKYYSVFPQNMCHNPNRKRATNRHRDRVTKWLRVSTEQQVSLFTHWSVRSEKSFESAKVVLATRHLKQQFF